MQRFVLYRVDDNGKQLGIVEDMTRIDATVVLGGVGFIKIPRPANYDKTIVDVNMDEQLHLYIRPYGGRPELVGRFFSRDWDWQTSARGVITQTVVGKHSNELLDRRVVAYASESTEANKTDYADDMMKEVVYENMGAGATAARQYENVSVESDGSYGPSVSKAFSYQNVLSTLQAIQQQSKNDGDEIYFGMDAFGTNEFVFRTYQNQPGQDRTSGTRNPIIFGTTFGNALDVSFSDTYADELTSVYALGRGVQDDRNIQQSTDATRASASIWNYREGVTQSDGLTDATVLAQAQSALENGRAVRYISATLLDTPSTPFGNRGWTIGTKVTIQQLGKRYDVIIKALTLQLDSAKKETIGAVMEIA